MTKPRKGKKKPASLGGAAVSKTDVEGLTPSAGARKLTDMQELFVREYLVDLNATQAAIRAGYSAHSAQEQSSRLLSNVIIKKRVQDGLKAKFSRPDMTAERILLELFRMATVDVSEAYDEQGTLKPIKEIPEDVRRCISGVEVAEIFNAEGDQVVGLNKKFKFTDKTKASELMAKYFRLLTEHHEHKHTFTLEDLVAGANDAGSDKD